VEFLHYPNAVHCTGQEKEGEKGGEGGGWPHEYSRRVQTKERVEKPKIFYLIRLLHFVVRNWMCAKSISNKVLWTTIVLLHEA
jgi:hypothetical protein